MGWHGPRGSCGCCGPEAQCFCPVDCECEEPELRGRYATQKFITLSNFPAAIEDHGTIACGDPSNPYKSVYWGVFGLNQLNDIYQLNQFPSCGSNTYKIFRCTFQIAEGVCKPTIQEACSNLSGSFVQYDVDCLAIISDNLLQVFIEDSALTSTYPCFSSFGLAFYYGRYWGNWFETKLGYKERWCENASAFAVISRKFLTYGTDSDDTACDNPLGLSTANCRKTPEDDFFVIGANFSATLSDRSSLPLTGYRVDITGLDSEAYIRAYTVFDQEAYLIEGLEALNGSYFAEIDPDECLPTFSGYSVPITAKAYSISTTSPCFFAGLFRQTTGTAYLNINATPGSKSVSVSITLLFDDLHRYYMSGIQFPYTKSVTLAAICQENCSNTVGTDICIDSSLDFGFEACISPVF